MDNCVFCKISRNEIPNYIVKEGKYSLAILDIEPGTEGHVLIIPKDHIQDLSVDANWQEIGAEMMVMAHEVLKALVAIYGYKGYRMFVNGGISSEHPHFHMHVYGQNRGQTADYYKQTPEGEVRDAALQATQSKYLEYFTGK